MKRALVLGGTGDIGSAIVARLLQSGMEVVGVGRNDFDLTSPKEIEKYFENNGNKFDILIHSGGFNVPKVFENLTEDEIRQSFDSNVYGFLAIARRLLPHWKKTKYGRILVISSLYGFLARKGRLPYVMSKHALNGVVKTLAIELAPDGVLVNALSPGYISTKLTFRNNSQDVIDKLVSSIPVARLGTPEDIAEVANFLCSAENRYINGQDIIVDGGYSVGAFQN